MSYLWVMANYYNMPEDTTLLIVTNVVFPIPPAINLTYFNVTILNPSYSISDVNITAVRLSVEGKNEVYNITATEPEPLPFLLRRGTEHTFKCKKNWSNFAGETVRIEPAAANTSTKSYSYTTPRVKLGITPDFDVTESVEHFNLTIENSNSIVNLTLSEIMLFAMSINENVTPTLPYVLPPNQSKTFQCNYNWESLRNQNVTITVKSSEGYEIVYTTDKLLGAILDIQEVKFDYGDVTYFNLTISNSEDSTASATINRINLTLQDETTVVINKTIPPINVQSVFNMILPNETRTFKCLWNWTQHRNETLTVNAYALEDFTIANKTTKTPPAVVWNITEVKFDLDDMQYFMVNVTNMPCSLNEINVTKILLDENETVIGSPVTIQPGEQKTINCTFSWKNWINKTVTINVFTESSLNVSTTMTVPPVGLKLLGDSFVFGDLWDQYINITIPYANVTISNSINSLQDVTITKIIFETGNKTLEIDNTLTYPKLVPSGYILRKGENITMTCLWNWNLYLGPYPIKVTVYTAEGFQVSRTWYPQIP
ncbi:MAG: hypothetical protein WAN82_02955 [Candidatus Bathyarchaeia archaeon]